MTILTAQVMATFAAAAQALKDHGRYIAHCTHARAPVRKMVFEVAVIIAGSPLVWVLRCRLAAMIDARALQKMRLQSLQRADTFAKASMAERSYGPSEASRPEGGRCDWPDATAAQGAGDSASVSLPVKHKRPRSPELPTVRSKDAIRSLVQ